MANQLLQYNKVAREVLYTLENTLGYARYCHTGYRKEYDNKRSGEQITIPKPPRYTLRRGNTMAVQGITQPNVVVTVRPKVGVDLELTHRDMDLIVGNKLAEFREKVVNPAVSQIAAGIDGDIADEARLNVYNYVGTAGALPANFAALQAPVTRLNEEGVPMDMRVGVYGARAHAAAVGILGAGGNFVNRVGDPAQRFNDLNFPILGMDRIVMSQSTPAHTVGVFAGVPVVDGAGQSGNSLRVRAMVAGDILNRGDVIQIAGVQAVNYQLRRPTGVLRQYVVTAQATADAAGIMTIPIYPPINPPIAGVAQQFQTVNAFPADGAAVTIVTGTTGAVNQESIVFQRDALGLISLPQVIPDDAYYCEELEYKGISMRFWMASDITNDRALMRIDWFGAIAAYYPEAACRMAA